MYRHTQRSFVGGVLDKELMGRTDLAKYYSGAARLDNFLVRRQGYISKRRGTELVADLDNLFGDGSYITHIRSIPFASTDRSIGYTLLFAASSSGLSRCFVCCKDGMLVTKTTTQSGVPVSEVREWSRAAYRPNESSGGLVNSYSAYSVTIPYSGGDFNGIGYFQSGDTLYLAHRGYPFARVTHPEEFMFAYNVIDFESIGLGSLPTTPSISSVTASTNPAFPSEGTTRQTVEYAVTAVAGGVESRPSNPFGKDYLLPWPDGGTMTVVVGTQTSQPDHYNVYKRVDGSEWGLIGSTESFDRYVRTYPTEVSGFTQIITTRGFNVSDSNVDDLAVGDSTRFASKTGKALFNWGGWCYVAGNGAFTVNFGAEGVKIDELHLGIGAAVTYPGGESDVRCTLIPATNVRFIRARVEFVSGTGKNINAVIGDTYQRRVDIVLPVSPTENRDEATKRAVKQLGSGKHYKFTVNDARNVASVTFTACTVNSYNASKLAIGTVEVGDGGSPATTGDPFVVYDFYATLNIPASANTFVDDYITPDLSIAPPKYEPHFNEPGLYPGCACMYNQRLALASTLEQPFTFFMSATGDIYNFNVHDAIREDDAIEATLPATKYPNINHMMLNRDLILFCDNGEWVVAPVSGNAMSYKTVSSKVQSQIGCSRYIVPIVVGNDVIFVNATNEVVHAIRYNYASDGYEDLELSVLSQDIMRGNPIVAMAYQKDPDSTIFCVMSDGSIAALVYMREHEVVAWSRLYLGGGMQAISCSADESVTAGTTNVFVVAETDEDGHPGYSLLRIREDAPFTDVASAVTMDRVETVEVGDGDAYAVPSGMAAVDLATGRVYAEGQPLPDGATYAVGYPFAAELVTVRPEVGQEESIQFEIKNAKSVELRALYGSSYKVKAFAAPERIPFTSVTADPSVGADGSVELDSSDHRTVIQGVNSRDGRIRLVHDDVWPMSVLQLSVNYEIQPLANSAG